MTIELGWRHCPRCGGNRGVSYNWHTRRYEGLTSVYCRDSAACKAEVLADNETATAKEGE
jgi:hypothetical protein